MRGHGPWFEPERVAVTLSNTARLHGSNRLSECSTSSLRYGNNVPRRLLPFCGLGGFASARSLRLRARRESIATSTMSLASITSAASDANWKLAPWLSKLGESGHHPSLASAIAGSLLSAAASNDPSAPASRDQLGFARSLRIAGREEVRRLLDEGGVLDAVADAIFGSLERAALMNTEKADLLRVRKISDRNWRVRKAALIELSKDQRALLAHKEAIAQALNDAEWEVSIAASVALGKLPEDALHELGLDRSALTEAHRTAVDRLSHTDVYVRIAAVHALDLLSPSDLATHAEQIVRHIQHTDAPTFKIASAKATADKDMHSPLSIQPPLSPSSVLSSGVGSGPESGPTSGLSRTSSMKRFGAAAEKIAHAKPSDEWAAHAAAGQARAERLAVHTGSAIVQRLAASYKSSAFLSQTALEPASLSKHGASMLQNLEDPSQWVRKEAAKMLAKLENASVLARHTPTLVADLNHREPECRRAAAKVLSKLGYEHLEPHSKALARCMTTEIDPDTRMYIVRTLGQLPGRVLAEFAGGLARRLLSDKDDDVRIASAQAMLRLEPRTLLRHVSALEIAVVNDPHAAVRDEVAKALKKIGPEAIASAEGIARRGSLAGPYTPMTRSATALPKIRRSDSQTASSTGL